MLVEAENTHVRQLILCTLENQIGRATNVIALKFFT